MLVLLTTGTLTTTDKTKETNETLDNQNNTNETSHENILTYHNIITAKNESVGKTKTVTNSDPNITRENDKKYDQNTHVIDNLLTNETDQMQLHKPRRRSNNLKPIPFSTIQNRSADIDLHPHDLEEAINYGIGVMKELIEVKEPMWYKMGLFLSENHPAMKVASFGAPNEKAVEMSRLGFAVLESSSRIASKFSRNVNNNAWLSKSFKSRILPENCPFRGLPRCPPASKRYRTADGSCNNLEEPWKGTSLLPFQRFLPPIYEDGLQTIRLSVLHVRLPSARDVSVKIHRDKNRELHSVTSMFVQWGQFVDHDVSSTVKARGFNGTVPRCCEKGAGGGLPQEFTHPFCLPIEISKDDWFYGQFGIRCMEFVRSAPSSRIDCDLGWREQINQVTPFIDASVIYGSDIETSDSIRTFRNGKIIYGRPRGMLPPDPPGGELCRSGVITMDCLQTGDGRASEQPGLTALHTVFVRYHNKIATILSKLNDHWSDEKVFQETRKIVYSAIQHITYREFLPIVVGPEVMKLFELVLLKEGYYDQYDNKTDPSIANSFSTAAFRFGHSMVPNSLMRADSHHRLLLNNVSLHEEAENIENIWSPGSIDRLLLGLSNQPSQRRDEFISEELTNHLFQPPSMLFGLDLAAINIQRGRDHGIPPYVSWRTPCGLTPIKDWKDLEKVTSVSTVKRFRTLYLHVNDVDLYTGGIAERPLRGSVVGPTFACIIAQQFLNLRKGDRFWYENGGFDSSFTPAQLQQVRKISLAQILCQTANEVETIQPFVFLSPDNYKNIRTECESLRNFDLAPWIEKLSFTFDGNESNMNELRRNDRKKKECVKKKKRVTTILSNTKSRLNSTRSTQNRKKTKKKTSSVPVKITRVTNITTTSQKQNKYGDSNSMTQRPTYDQYGSNPNKYQTYNNQPITYLVGSVPEKSQKPLEVNIKIQYYPPTTTTKAPTPIKKKRPNNNVVLVTKRPSTTRRSSPTYVQSGVIQIIDRPPSTKRPTDFYSYDNLYQTSSSRPYISDDLGYLDRPSYSDNYVPIHTKRPPNNYNNNQNSRPSSSTFRPYYYPSNSNQYANMYPTKRPTYYDEESPYIYSNTNRRPTFNNGQSYNRDEIIDEIYSEMLYNDRLHDKPTGFITDLPSKILNRPYKIHPIRHDDRLDDSNDKLDFKTRFVTKQTYKDQEDLEDEFVQISSVKGQSVLGLQIENREGDGEIEQKRFGPNKVLKKFKVVDIDIAPSEISDNDWLLFNATNEDLDEIPPTLLDVPERDSEVSYSDEFPKRMNTSFVMTKTRNEIKTRKTRRGL